MFTNTNITTANEEEPSFPLFNFEILKNMSNQTLPPRMFSPLSMALFDEKTFLKKDMNFDQNIEIFAKKRGRKPKKVPTKDITDLTITIKEIVEDQYSGIPTTDEIKMKQEKLRKMREGKAKKALKNGSINDENNMSKIIAIIPEVKLFPNEEKKQNLENLGSSSNPFAPRIVMKDGKAVIEQHTYDLVRFTPEDSNNLIVIRKPARVTSSSFTNRTYTKIWTPEEDKLFFKCIRHFGTDFGMIAKFFKTRDRKQIKNKFNKEDKENPQKVTNALKKGGKVKLRAMDDKITALNNAIVKEYAKKGAIVEEPENSVENCLETFDTIPSVTRNNSTTSSVDSMDMNIVNEMQAIFNTEIEQIRKKRKAAQIPFFLCGLSGLTLKSEVKDPLFAINSDAYKTPISVQNPNKLDFSLLW